jgi:hypothetical protein
MAAVAQPVDARRAYQREVASLLEELEARRAQLQRLKAFGVRPAGLRDPKADFEAARRRLADLVQRRRGAGRQA